MESDGDGEHETVIIAGDYDGEYEGGIQGATQLTVVQAQQIIRNAGHEIDSLSPASSGSKGKYYKQTYRTAWENMPDFKGWLRAVPGQATRAFCTYCQKSLHAHRLSLLKHTCTMRHQKAAQLHQARKMNQPTEQITNFEVLVQNTTEPGSEEAHIDQTMDEDSFLDEEHDENEGEEDDEEEESEETPIHSKKEQKSVQYPKSLIMTDGAAPISTHVLDTTKGYPVHGLLVSLYKLIDGRWTFINEGHTNVEGYLWNFIDRKDFSTGRYKLHYDVDRYFDAKQQPTIYPFIEVVFDVRGVEERLHIPLLINPYGYTTYKG